MKKTNLLLIFFIGVMGMVSVFPNTALAGEITPTLSLVYGAELDLSGSLIEYSMNKSLEAEMEWLAIDFNWREAMPTPERMLLSSELQYALNFATQHNIQLLVRINNAPDWAMTESGPDGEMVANLVFEIANAYPSVAAIELFPGANTLYGWGTTPSPGGYMVMLNQVNSRLKDFPRSITTVSLGLTPEIIDPADIPEIDYLKAIYALNGKAIMPTISIQYPDTNELVTISPIEDPTYAVRRYELIRDVMIANEHSDGRIWITRIGWPNYMTQTGKQANWLVKTYLQLNAQYYIEMSIFDQLNPNLDAGTTLINQDMTTHPGLWLIEKLTKLSHRQLNVSTPHLLTPRSDATIP